MHGIGLHDLSGLIALLHMRELAVSIWQGAIVLGGLFCFVYFFERRQGIDRARYASKNFLNDVLYSLFYKGGFYQVFIFAAFANALGPRLDFFKVQVLAGLPLVLQAILYWVTVDFLGYWIHRFQHANPFLWAFHSVHHAQERLNFLTSYRVHPVEQLTVNLLMFVPQLIIGIPTRNWIPLYLVQVVFEGVQHTELDWRYGRAYPVFVSPVFHAFHHSTSPEHYNRNFGKILSLWDFLFGTAVRDEKNPKVFGIEGTKIAESVVTQFVTPFRVLYRRMRHKPAPNALAGGSPS